MKLWIFLAAAAALSGCAPSKEEIAAKEAQAARLAFADVAQAHTKSQMFDPASAELRNLTVSTSEGKMFLCGEVNANNRFGAKAGFRAFVTGYRNDDPTRLATITAKDGNTIDAAMPCVKVWNDAMNAQGKQAEQEAAAAILEHGCGDSPSFQAEFWATVWSQCANGEPLRANPPVRFKSPRS